MSRLTEALHRFQKLEIDRQIDYEKLYLYSIITHSTAIEGSTVTEIENRLLFDEGISANKPIAEQLMNLDLKNAYEYGRQLFGRHETITVPILCELSQLVMKNTGCDYRALAGNFSSSRGELRLLNVSAGLGGRSYLAWQKVPERLQQFCDWLNERRKTLRPDDIDGIYELSFEAHYRLVVIHPWADGNGRMSRLLMNMIQYEFGVMPSIVKKENKAEYIESLAKAGEKEDMTIFLNFMRDHHIQNIEEHTKDYLASINETISSYDDTINETINLTPKEQAVLSVLKVNPQARIAEIVETTGFSRSTVTRALGALQEKKLIRRVGARKNGHWEIKGGPNA